MFKRKAKVDATFDALRRSPLEVLNGAISEFKVQIPGRRQLNVQYELFQKYSIIDADRLRFERRVNRTILRHSPYLEDCLNRHGWTAQEWSNALFDSYYSDSKKEFFRTMRWISAATIGVTIMVGIETWLLLYFFVFGLLFLVPFAGFFQILILTTHGDI